MFQYIIFFMVLISLVYNHYRKQPLLTNGENKRIEKVIEKVGIENVMEKLNTDEEFKEASKELDKKLSDIILSNKKE